MICSNSYIKGNTGKEFQIKEGKESKLGTNSSVFAVTVAAFNMIENGGS